LSHRERHARPADAAPADPPAARAPDCALPPRRGRRLARRGRLAARVLPAPTPRDARRARRVRRGLSALRRGHRPLLPRDARGLGALVRPRGARDARLGAGDRQAVPLTELPLARAEHGPLRQQASGDAGAAVTPKKEQYARKAEGWTDAEYADARAYLDHRAELIATLGAPLRAGDEVLDLACGDGGLGEHLLARGLAYTGIDAEPAMVDAARRRLGDRATIGVGDLNAFVPEA